jgi:hypothetical protein
MIDWDFYPEHYHATWAQAREVLTAAVKPLIVAPLLESGSVAIWSIGSLNPEHLAKTEREFDNQRRYFDEKVEVLKLCDSDRIETPDGSFALSVGDFKQWAADYALLVGVGMGPSPVPRTGRIHIRPPGGCRPPVGLWSPAS